MLWYIYFVDLFISFILDIIVEGGRTGIESDLSIALPVPDRAVFVHQFIYTELTVSEH